MIKHSLVFGALIALAATAGADVDPGLNAGTYKIDPTHSYGHFEVNHMGLSTMHGRIDIKSGTIQIDPSGGQSQVAVTLDPASVNTGNKARDEHLRDMDGFFDVKKYPSMKFESTSVTFDDHHADKATVKGNFTMHGVTRLVTLDVDDIACRINPLEKSQYTCGFAAETKLKRSDYGMDAYLPLVGDKIDLSIEIEASKPVGA